MNNMFSAEGAYFGDQYDQSFSEEQVISDFDDMPIPLQLLRGIYAYGFEKPSAIQQRAIVSFIKGRDIISQAQSGTGKTGAFAIGLLARVDFGYKRLQALVLTPTRELAFQTSAVISALGEHLGQAIRPFCVAFVGGTRVQDSIRKTQTGIVVAVGTPGRVFDLIARGALRTDFLRCMVLDEADEMLSIHLEQVLEIFEFLPREIQIALFSTTMSSGLLDLTTPFMRKPSRTLVERDSLILESIKQYYVAVEEENKLDTLMALHEFLSAAQAVVFAGTCCKVDQIAETLNNNNHTVSAIHSNMLMCGRNQVMSEFKSGSFRVLVATDLVARGIDVYHVNIVINYDLPTNKKNYLHRIGRGGRYGGKGVAISFVSQRDVQLLREIEAHYHTQIERLPMDLRACLGK